VKRAIAIFVVAGAGLAALHAVAASFTGSDPVVVAFNVVRLAAVAAGVYLEFVASVHIVARATRSASALGVASAVTLPSLVLVLAPAASAGAQTGRDVVTMHLLDVEQPTAAIPAPLPPSVPAQSDADTWTVAPGDSFWSIATDVVRDARGGEPTDDDVLPYWHALLDANEDNLAVPGNPDLLFAGQELVLPPLSAA
jgi:hypothetical protein